MISQQNPLHQFFRELIVPHFQESGLRDPAMQDYVVNLVVEFSASKNLFEEIKNVDGKPVVDVGAMILESDPIYGPAPSFDRERQVRKHVGDYTLFFCGLFPEAVNRFLLRRQRLEHFIDFVKAGQESYHIVSAFAYFEYAKVAPLFEHLSRDFEQCIYALQETKNHMREIQFPLHARPTDIIM